MYVLKDSFVGRARPLRAGLTDTRPLCRDLTAGSSCRRCLQASTAVCTLTIVVCNVTQALGRFTYAYWRRANIVCKPANIVCGPGRGRPRLKPGLGHPSLKRHRFSCRLANLTSGCAYLIIAIVQLLPILAHTSHFSRPSEHASTTPSTRARAGVWRTTIAGGAVGLSPDERRSRHRCTMPQ